MRFKARGTVAFPVYTMILIEVLTDFLVSFPESLLEITLYTVKAVVVLFRPYSCRNTVMEFR